jgi:hypothetical protein
VNHGVQRNGTITDRLFRRGSGSLDAVSGSLTCEAEPAASHRLQWKAKTVSCLGGLVVDSLDLGTTEQAE